MPTKVLPRRPLMARTLLLMAPMGQDRKIAPTVARSVQMPKSLHHALRVEKRRVVRAIIAKKRT